MVFGYEVVPGMQVILFDDIKVSAKLNRTETQKVIDFQVFVNTFKFNNWYIGLERNFVEINRVIRRNNIMARVAN